MEGNVCSSNIALVPEAVKVMQYWNGASWVTVPGGSVSGNNKVWRQFQFAAVSTTKIRVLTNASPDNYSRLTELEAWSSPP